MIPLSHAVSSQSRTCLGIYFTIKFNCQSRSFNISLCSWVRTIFFRDTSLTRVFFSLRCSSTVVLYDIHNQKQDFIINNARKSITSLSLSVDGRYLATGEVKRAEPDKLSCDIENIAFSVWSRSKSTCLGSYW